MERSQLKSRRSRPCCNVGREIEGSIKKEVSKCEGKYQYFKDGHGINLD